MMVEEQVPSFLKKTYATVSDSLSLFGSTPCMSARGVARRRCPQLRQRPSLTDSLFLNTASSERRQWRQRTTSSTGDHR